MTLPSGYEVREAGPVNLAVLALMRTKMAVDMGSGPLEELLPGSAFYRAWAEEHFAAGRFRGWLASSGGDDVAGLSLWLKSTQPAVRTGETLVPYILGVYCEPSHRRRGLVRSLMERAVSWCRAAGYGSVQLHASQDGLPLYRDLGFLPTTEMRLDLREAPK